MLAIKPGNACASTVIDSGSIQIENELTARLEQAAKKEVSYADFLDELPAASTPLRKAPSCGPTMKRERDALT